MASNHPRTPAEGGRVDNPGLRPALKSGEKQPVSVPVRPPGGREGGAQR
jgi:hypothetical protein